MSRPFECDNCFALDYSTKLPVGWRLFFFDKFKKEIFGEIAEAEPGAVGHLCVSCVWTQEIELKAVKRILDLRKNAKEQKRKEKSKK